MTLKGEEKIQNNQKERFATMSERYRSLMLRRDEPDREKAEQSVAHRIKEAEKKGTAKIYDTSGLDAALAILRKIRTDDPTIKITVHEKDGAVIVCEAKDPTPCHLMMLGWRTVCDSSILDNEDEIEEV